MKEDLPASVSNQNREEAEPGHGGGEERGDAPDTPDTRRGEREKSSQGEAGEASQSTGDPNSAG